MTKTEINNKLREFARTLSPTENERGIVGDLYSSFQTLLGTSNCLQVGSYPRFTAITPLHDLDILYVIGEWHTDWPKDSYTSEEVIDDLVNKITNDFEQPDGCEVLSIDKQTHSVSVTFKSGTLEYSVDVVPAYMHGTNEFDLPTYRVPEILKEKKHDKRLELYQTRTLNSESVGWIDSDPRGYISVATEVGKNPDFRKTVKIVKHWKGLIKQEDENLRLKSFHVEQIITQYFQIYSEGTIFDALFTFFVDFPNTALVANQISDRANPDKFIDDYVEKFSADIKKRLTQARDGVLINLEEIDTFDFVEEVFKPYFRERMSPNEKYLFDDRIPVLLESEHDSFNINADITDKPGNIQRSLNRMGIIDSGRYLKFKRGNIDGCEYKWKVKNDDRSDQPRGEITDGHTLNVPENTKYIGGHYVECYAVLNRICIAKFKHNVVIQRGSGKIKIQK